MALSDFLDQECNLKLQNEDDQDEAGGIVREPYTVMQTLVPCLVRELGGSSDPVDGKATQTIVSRVYFDPDDLDPSIGITKRYLIEVLPTPGSGEPTRELSVNSKINYNSMGRLLSVDCTEQAV